MAKLITPDETTEIVKYGGWTKHKKWHILKDGKLQKGICGAVCIDPEYSTLGEIKAKDICAMCWPYRKE